MAAETSKSKLADSSISEIEREIVILVHGTGATDVSASGTRWWQAQGTLTADMVATLGTNIAVEAFIWSGANNEIDRRDAGERLARRLLELSKEGFRCHLIGHSHGGSVIWHALRWLESKNTNVDWLASWATIGTPFLTYRLRRGRLLLAGLALGLSLITLSALIIPLDGINLAYAWRDAPIQVTLWSILVLLPVMCTLWGALALKPAIGGERSQNSRTARRLALPDTLPRYLSLWSSRDEAIHGLAGTGSFSIRFIQEAVGESRNFFLAPLLLLRQTFGFVWRAVNQIVNSNISRALQGSTLEHIELRACDPWPSVALAHKPLPSSLDNKLVTQADSHAAELGRRARDILISGSDPVTGFVDLQRTATRAVSFKELVHTTYFEEPRVRALLIHHVAHNSKLFACNGICQPDDRDWYEQRVTQSDLRFPKEPPTLPSNRFSAVVACGAVALITLLGLIGIACSALYESAFAPTTAGYWLPKVANELRLASAVVAESPSNLLSASGLSKARRDEEIDEVKFDDKEDAGPAMYLNAFMTPKGISKLASMVRALPSEELRIIFYLRAFPYLLASTPEDLVDQLLEPGALLPGPSYEVIDLMLPDVNDKGGRFEAFPGALSEVVFQLTRRDLMTQERFGKIQEFCGQAQLCRERLAMEQVLTMAARGKYDDARYIAPLPPLYGKPFADLKARVFVPNVESVSSVPDMEIERFPNYRQLKAIRHRDMQYGRDNLMFWLVANGAWDYAAAYFSSRVDLDNRIELPWAALAPQIVGTINVITTNSHLANAVLIVAVNAQLDSPVPDDVVESLRKLLPLQVDSPIVRKISPKLFEKFASRQKQRAACSAPVSPPALTATNSELGSGNVANPMKPPSCESVLELGESRAGREARDSINGALENSDATLGGSKGILSIITSQARNKLSDQFRGETLEKMMGRVFLDICRQKFDLTEQNRNDLLGTLKALYPMSPLTVGTTSMLQTALSSNGIKINCPVPIEKMYERDTTKNLGLLALPLAKWNLYSQPDLAIKMVAMSSPAFVPKGSSVDLSDFEEAIAFLLDTWNPYFVIEITNNQATNYGLLRRSGLVQSAICLQAANAGPIADEVFRLSQVTDRLGRAVARSGELHRVTELEVMWYVRKGDWRSAMNVCQNCDSRTEQAALSHLIPALLVGPTTAPPYNARCQGLEDKHLDMFRKMISEPQESTAKLKTSR